MVYEITSVGENTVTAGIKEVPDGKAQTYVEATVAILDSLKIPDVMTHVTSFMTDRSATESKVNNMLCETTDKPIGHSSVRNFRTYVKNS